MLTARFLEPVTKPGNIMNGKQDLKKKNLKIGNIEAQR